MFSTCNHWFQVPLPPVSFDWSMGARSFPTRFSLPPSVTYLLPYSFASLPCFPIDNALPRPPCTIPGLPASNWSTTPRSFPTHLLSAPPRQFGSSPVRLPTLALMVLTRLLDATCLIGRKVPPGDLSLSLTIPRLNSYWSTSTHSFPTYPPPPVISPYRVLIRSFRLFQRTVSCGPRRHTFDWSTGVPPTHSSFLPTHPSSRLGIPPPLLSFTRLSHLPVSDTPSLTILRGPHTPHFLLVDDSSTVSVTSPLHPPLAIYLLLCSSSHLSRPLTTQRPPVPFHVVFWCHDFNLSSSAHPFRPALLPPPQRSPSFYFLIASLNEISSHCTPHVASRHYIFDCVLSFPIGASSLLDNPFPISFLIASLGE